MSACTLQVTPKSCTKLATTLLHKCYTKSITPYDFGSQIMDSTVRQFLDYKLRHPRIHDIYSISSTNPSADDPPPATLLTFQFEPTYTLGRRDRGSLSPSRIADLSDGGRAHVEQTFRGGQTTFHGPGQLVAYPIIDLRAFRASGADGLPVRCFVELLERAVITTLRTAFGLTGAHTTEHTGVWMDAQNKVCAMGIHVRRHVTSHGIGLNVSTDTAWFDRIVACGLPDKKTTTVAAELQKRGMVAELGMEYAASAFAKELATALNLELQEEFF